MKDPTLPTRLDGVQRVQQRVFRHAGEGAGQAVVEKRKGGGVRVPFFPFQVFDGRNGRRRRGGRGGHGWFYDIYFYNDDGMGGGGAVSFGWKVDMVVRWG
mmetsp:Transcript_5162/g.10301  ORF Transcript_5162/g.10301 Transcript_5162/m.10301 type:complete len:100 (+) Transcript_5162:326-625(+)